MTRAELEEIDEPLPTIGSAEVAESDEEHGAHTFLYVPDLANQTGWSTHRVPERQPDRRERQPIGFRR